MLANVQAGDTVKVVIPATSETVERPVLKVEKYSFWVDVWNGVGPLVEFGFGGNMVVTGYGHWSDPFVTN